MKIDTDQLKQATAFLLETNKYIYEQAEELARQHLEADDNKNFKARVKLYEFESKETLLHFADEITAWAEINKDHEALDFIQDYFNLKSPRRGFYE